MKTKLLAVLFAALICIVGVQAASEDHPMMEMSNTVITCRVDMSNEVIGNYIDKVPQTEDKLSEHIDILTEDKNVLNEYNNESDWRNFYAYRLNTYALHQRDAFKDVLGVWLNFIGWNVSKDTRDELKDNAKTSKTEFEECKFQALKTFAEHRSGKYDEKRQEWEQKIDELKEKNPELDTDGMQQVLDDVDVLKAEYDTAVEEASTSKELFEAIRGYCLFNGCPMGKNFHFAAKISLAKQEAILALISPNAIEADLEDLVEEAQGYLDTASDTLDEIGTDNYTFQSREEVWNNLRDANAKIREIVSVLSSDTAAGKG